MLSEPRPTLEDASRLAMMAALVEGDVDMALRLALDLLDQGLPLEHIVAAVLQPVQGELGQRWADGDMGVADEHASSAAVEALLTRLSATGEPATGPRVVVASVESDAHALGGRVVAAVLGLEGFRVQYLGASVPAADLGEYVELQEPHAVVLSCSVTRALVGAAASVAAVHAHGVPVVLGGRGIASADRARRLGADAWAQWPAEVVAVLQEWQAAPPPRLGAGPAPVPEHAPLARRGPALVAVALDAFAADAADDADHAGFAAEVSRLLGVLESALLVDEPQLVPEHLTWLLRTGPAHGFDEAAVTAGIEALRGALDGDLARAGTLLGDALG